MGAYGSKEDIEKLGTVYGYNCNDITWRQSVDKNVYHTNCIIITYHDKKYVMTTREKIISCANICMYYAISRESEYIMRNDMYILFQQIELNLVILATVGENSFVEDKSILVSGEIFPKDKTTEFYLDEFYKIPTKKSTYSIISLNFNLESMFDAESTIDFHIYDAKYEKSIIFDKIYVPEMYNYLFKFDKKPDNSLHGICGSVILDSNNNLVGIVSRIIESKIYILPKRIIYLAFDRFTNFLENNIYLGFLFIPFRFIISGENVMIDGDCIVNTVSNPHFILKNNDKLLSINDKELVIKNDNVMIFDDCLKDLVTVEIYLKLNTEPDSPINLAFFRKNIYSTIDCIGSKFEMPFLTDQPYFKPSCPIPYVNFNGIIFVKLTHELYDLMIQNRIIIQNEMVSDLISGALDKNVIIILDCLNKPLVKKYRLPQIQPGTKSKIKCPFVTQFDDSTTVDLDLIQQKINKKLVKMRIGLTSTDQKFIELFF